MSVVPVGVSNVAPPEPILNTMPKFVVLGVLSLKLIKLRKTALFEMNRLL